MRTKKVLVIALAAIAAGVALSSCGGTKQIAGPGYSGAQATPPNVQQQQSANRGLKMDKEECEEKALEEGITSHRDFGNAISDKESFAVNLALLDARAKLAQQLEVQVSGLARNFDQQHEAAGASASVGKASQIQQGYFEQFLTNSRPICKNTYIKEDGKYNVYVCIEMNEQQQRAMYKKLTEDKIVAVDFAEHQFMQELAKAKEDYRQKQLAQ